MRCGRHFVPEAKVLCYFQQLWKLNHSLLYIRRQCWLMLWRSRDYRGSLPSLKESPELSCHLCTVDSLVKGCPQAWPSRCVFFGRCLWLQSLWPQMVKQNQDSVSVIFRRSSLGLWWDHQVPDPLASAHFISFVTGAAVNSIVSNLDGERCWLANSRQFKFDFLLCKEAGVHFIWSQHSK